MTRWRALVASVGLVGALALFIPRTAEEQVQKNTGASLGVGRYRDGRGRMGREGPLSGAVDWRAFEFAPLSGFGMPAACSTTAPFGINDGGVAALTVKRDGGAYCFTGTEGINGMPGIANGSLVWVGNDVARVQPGGDGYGALGVKYEAAAVNGIAWPSDFTNAAWNKLNNTSAPVITASDGGAFFTAPDGTLTAQRITFPATTEGVGYSIIYEAACPVGSVGSGSIFVRAATQLDGGDWNSTGASSNPRTSYTDLAINTSTFPCRQCRAVSDSWTRCVKDDVTASANGFFIFGNDSADCGPAHGPVDLLIWNAQCEPGSRSTSPIPGNGSGGVRAAETIDLAVNLPLTGQFCVAATVEVPFYLLDQRLMRLEGSLSNGAVGVDSIPDAGVDSYQSTSGTWVASSTMSSLGTVDTGLQNIWPRNRVVTFHNATAFTGCLNGTCAGGSLSTGSSGTMTRFRLGGPTSATGQHNGTIKQVQVDGSPTRCDRTSSFRVPTYAAIGDSITSCQGLVGNCWADSLRWERGLSTKDIISMGRDSQLTPYMRDTEWTWKVKNQGFTGIFVLGGINDIAAGGTAATIMAPLQDIYNEARDGGLSVVAMTVLPFGEWVSWTAPKQTQLDALNTLIRAQNGVNGVTVVDMYNSVLRVQDGGTAAEHQYFLLDRLHLNQFGSDMAGAILIDAGVY